MYVTVKGPKPKPLTWLVNNNGCYICTSHGCDTDGYPRKGVNYKLVRLSRFIWTECFGEISADLCVLHRCDNPKCIRIDHLFLGTHADNLKDMWEKRRGRGSKGEQNGRAKLTKEQVLYIRSSPLSRDIMARRFNVSRQNILYIQSRRIWKHI